MTEIAWIGVDWGTTRLRAWGLSAAGDILRQAQSAKGMASLAPAQFEAALLDTVNDWLRPDAVTSVVICGMAGARQGWREAPYRAAPCAPVAAGGSIAVPTSDARLAVHIVAGVSQAQPADVMRGEETLLAGLLAAQPDYSGAVCLPGTHSKWVEVNRQEITDFQTCMTGELFALIAEQSVLRHGLRKSAAEAPDERAFIEAVDEVLANPAAFSTGLFSLRAEALLHGLAAAAARSRLSGLLIGAELAATRARWVGRPVCIVGNGELAANYQLALRSQGVDADIADAETTTLAGLAAALATLQT